MNEYLNLATEMVKNLSGEENIYSVQHCTTRLRFKLKDESLAKDDNIKKLDGIVTVMKAGGQYQVVVGTHVPNVYEAVMKVVGLKSEQPVDLPKKKMGIIAVLIDTMTGVMGPFIPLLTAAGFIKGINILFVVFGLYSGSSGIYILVGAIGDAFFKFLPIFLGYTASKKFGGNPFLGMLLGTILCYPTINGTNIDLFGYVVNASYYSTIFPVLFTTLVAAKVEKFVAPRLPEIVRTIFTPVITLLVAVPLGFSLIGPLANYLGSGLTNGISLFLGFSPILAGIIFGGLIQVFVVFGIHGLIMTTIMTNVFSGIPDPITGLIGFASHAFTAMALAVAIRTRNKKTKSLAIPATITGLFGVTEPILYGLALPNITMFVTASIGAAVGGALGGFFGIKTFQFTGSGIIALLGYINPADASSITKVLIAWLATYVVSFVLSFILYKDPKSESNESTENLNVIDSNVKVKKEEVYSPIKGKVIALSDLSDAAFAGGDLGKGIAILPEEGIVVSPFNGVVRAVFPTKHAIGIVSENGCEVLIHIGLDTVNLGGKYFDLKVNQGDSVKAGEVLIKFDLKALVREGYTMDTPIVVTNSGDYVDLIETTEKQVKKGDSIFTVLL